MKKDRALCLNQDAIGFRFARDRAGICGGQSTTTKPQQKQWLTWHIALAGKTEPAERFGVEGSGYATAMR